MRSVWSWEASPSGMAIRYLAFFYLKYVTRLRGMPVPLMPFCTRLSALYPGNGSEALAENALGSVLPGWFPV